MLHETTEFPTWSFPATCCATRLHGCSSDTLWFTVINLIQGVCWDRTMWAEQRQALCVKCKIWPESDSCFFVVRDPQEFRWFTLNSASENPPGSTPILELCPRALEFTRSIKIPLCPCSLFLFHADPGETDFSQPCTTGDTALFSTTQARVNISLLSQTLSSRGNRFFTTPEARG